MTTGILEQRHHERVRVFTRLLDRHPGLWPAGAGVPLPAEPASRAKALRAMAPEQLNAAFSGAVHEHLFAKGDMTLPRILGLIEMCGIPTPLSVMAELTGDNEKALAEHVKELEELGLVGIAERTGLVSVTRIIDGCPRIALDALPEERFVSFASWYYTALATAAVDEPDTPYATAMQALHLVSLVHLEVNHELMERQPSIAMAFVEIAIMQGPSLAAEAIPRAQEILARSMDLVIRNVVDLDVEGRVELTRLSAILLLRQGEFDTALELLEGVRPLAATLEPEASLGIETAVMAVFMQSASPRTGEQALAALRLARQLGHEEIAEVALTIRFGALATSGEELQLLAEHDAEQVRVRPPSRPRNGRSTSPTRRRGAATRRPASRC